MVNLAVNPYRGTRDYYPEDKQKQEYIFGNWRKVVESYGYNEYLSPLLEPIELYKAKSGQEIVNDQTYRFVDRGGREVAIRPEMTPSVCRMIAAREQSISYPARLYSIANFMRYERPQRGREREFWQLNADLFGIDSIEADIEMISLAHDVVRAFPVNDDDFIIRINHRGLINCLMQDYLGLSDDDSTKMIKLFDKKDKINIDDFIAQANEIVDYKKDKTSEIINKLLKLLDSKTLTDLPNRLKDSLPYKNMEFLFNSLSDLSINDYQFDLSLVRGLDYYTGIVFEVYDTHPENSRAIFGGGRYDGLVGLFGGKQISAVGMGLGGTMFENFLNVRNLLPEYNNKTKLFIAVMPGFYIEAIKFANKLREFGVNVSVDLSNDKIGKQIKTADRQGIRYLIVFGENEAKGTSYGLKKLATGEINQLNITDLVKKLA